MPSEKVLSEKKQIVSELKDKLSRAAAGVLVDYRGLTVGQDTDLRNKLRVADVEYKVVKNTLTRFAILEAGFDELDPSLHGPTSLALSFTDPVAPAKILSEFAKKNKKLEIKAGFVEGRVIGLDEIKALAALPSREVLIAKALGGFNAPISGFANVLSANIRGLVIALNAVAQNQ